VVAATGGVAATGRGNGRAWRRSEIGTGPIEERRPLGRTGLLVTPVCVGASPLASVPEIFGYEVPVQQAVDTVRRVLRGPVNFLDTSAIYGFGESERRIGLALAAEGGAPEGFVLATKADRDPDTGDFSAGQARRSVERSLELLGVQRLPLLYLHDPEHLTFAQGMAADGPVGELIRMRDEGLVDHLGVAGGPIGLMGQYVRTDVFDVLLTHSRWTLVDRSADGLISEASERGLGVVNAAVFGGGILAAGPGRTTSYAYAPASTDLLHAIGQMEQACARYGVPLAAAALQVSLRDQRIASTVVGISRPERVDELLVLARTRIPPELSDELEALVPG